MVYGYTFEFGEKTYREWFINSDGEEITVTSETEDEYNRIWQSKIELERYDITEANISKIIYDRAGDF